MAQEVDLLSRANTRYLVEGVKAPPTFHPFHQKGGIRGVEHTLVEAGGRAVEACS